MRVLATAAAGLVVLALAGCGTRPVPGEEGPPRATLICAPQPREDAYQRLLSTFSDGMHGLGYDVLGHVTTLPRAVSSVAVYDVRRHPERLEHVMRWLADAGVPEGSVQVLPFYQHGAGGNAIVAWLVPPAPAAAH